MDVIEQRAREIYAAQFPGDCGYETREWIMEGRYGDDETIAAIIAALTPPEGFVLVPVKMTKEIGDVLDESIKHKYSAESAWDLAVHAARPEVP